MSCHDVDGEWMDCGSEISARTLLWTKLTETRPSDGAGESAEPSLGYMGCLLWPVLVLGSGRCLDTNAPWCLAFLARQTSTWQRFLTVSVSGGYIDRCRRMAVKSVHDILMFFPASQVFFWHSLMHTLYKGLLPSPFVCTAMCALAHHTQPSALGHALGFFFQGKVTELLWAVSI